MVFSGNDSICCCGFNGIGKAFLEGISAVFTFSIEGKKSDLDIL
jgi:hypothetical protein